MINITNKRTKRLYVAEFERRMSVVENTFFRELRPLLGRQFFNAAQLVTMGVGIEGVDHAIDLGRRRLMNLFKNHYKRVATVFSRRAYQIFEQSKKSIFPDSYEQIDFAIELKGPKDEFWMAINNWGRLRMAKATPQVQNTTKRIVRRVIRKGMQEGESHREIAKRLRATSQRINPHRSRTIALTETHGAAVKSVDVAVASTRIEMEREWVSAKDDRTRTRDKSNRFEHYRSFPNGADGERVAQDGKFIGTGQALDYPGDSKGSAGNVIRCRCVIIYHTVKRTEQLKPHEPEIDPEVETIFTQMGFDTQMKPVRDMTKIDVDRIVALRDELTSEFGKIVLTKEEKAALEVFKLNPSKINAKQQAILNAAIERHSISKERLLYRGVHGTYVDEIKKIPVGGVIQSDRILSTSASQDIAEWYAERWHKLGEKGTVIVIKTPKGIPGLFVSQKGVEVEVLLAQKIPLKVVGKKGRHILVEIDIRKQLKPKVSGEGYLPPLKVQEAKKRFKDAGVNTIKGAPKGKGGFTKTEFLSNAVNPTLEEMERMLVEFPILKEVLKITPLKELFFWKGKYIPVGAAAKRTMAQYSAKAKKIETAMINSSKNINPTLSFGEEIANVGKGEFRANFRHEIGHHYFETIMFEQYNVIKRGQFIRLYRELGGSKYFKKNISKYAGTNFHEGFAEVFSAYTSPKYKKGMLPKEIEKYFDKLLRKK